MRVFLCEKPSQGKDIARVLGASQRGNGCYSGAGVVVTWCIGHLVEAVPPEGYGEQYKRWAIEQLPILPKRWRVEPKAATAVQFKVVQQLVAKAELSRLREKGFEARGVAGVADKQQNRLRCPRANRGEGIQKHLMRLLADDGADANERDLLVAEAKLAAKPRPRAEGGHHVFGNRIRHHPAARTPDLARRGHGDGLADSDLVDAGQAHGEPLQQAPAGTDSSHRGFHIVDRGGEGDPQQTRRIGTERAR